MSWLLFSRAQIHQNPTDVTHCLVWPEILAAVWVGISRDPSASEQRCCHAAEDQALRFTEIFSSNSLGITILYVSISPPFIKSLCQFQCCLVGTRPWSIAVPGAALPAAWYRGQIQRWRRVRMLYTGAEMCLDFRGRKIRTLCSGTEGNQGWRCLGMAWRRGAVLRARSSPADLGSASRALKGKEETFSNVHE